MALNTAVGGATGRGDELKLSTKSFFERFSWPDMILASPFHATMDSFLVDKRGYRRMESQLSEDAAIYIRSEFELGVERARLAKLALALQHGHERLRRADGRRVMHAHHLRVMSHVSHTRMWNEHIAGPTVHKWFISRVC